MKKFFPNSYFSFLRLLYSGLIAFTLVLGTENTIARHTPNFAKGGNTTCAQAQDCYTPCTPSCPPNAQCQNGNCICKEDSTSCCTATSCPSTYYCKDIGQDGFGKGCISCPSCKIIPLPENPLPSPIPPAACEHIPLCPAQPQ